MLNGKGGGVNLYYKFEIWWEILMKWKISDNVIWFK